MKTLAIFCLHYGGITGSELYFYELVKFLKKYFKITIYSNFNKLYSDYTFFQDVEYVPLNSEKNKKHYNYIIFSHGNYILKDIKESIVDMKNSLVVNIIHSEVLPQETPLLVKEIYSYVAIRPNIKKYLIDEYKLDNVTLIYNPIDENRFNTIDTIDDKYALFVGTLNHLRVNSLLDFINCCGYNKIKFIGDVSNQFDSLSDKIEFINPEWNIEKYIKNASIVGGIMYGRSYWESKMCGKPTIEYIVDASGKIINRDINYEKIDTIHVESRTVEKEFLKLLNI